MEVTEIDLIERYGDLNTLFEQGDIDKDGYIGQEEAIKFFPHFKITREVLKNVILI